MTKRPITERGVFTRGLRRRHFEGRSATRRRLDARAESARQRRINWLRRHHPMNPAAEALATKLEGCQPKKRCKSGACPVCTRAAQNLFVEIVRQLAEGEVQDGK